jgi:hypothetical protein
MPRWLAAVLLVCFAPAAGFADENRKLVRLRGAVVDANTGRPLACRITFNQRAHPPGRPRTPACKALLMALHFSPSASTTGPERSVGHFPIRSRCASAHSST